MFHWFLSGNLSDNAKDEYPDKSLVHASSQYLAHMKLQY